jgi:hypothetical protein
MQIIIGKVVDALIDDDDNSLLKLIFQFDDLIMNLHLSLTDFAHSFFILPKLRSLLSSSSTNIPSTKRFALIIIWFFSLLSQRALGVI